jgi:hypothetical protein
VVIPISVDRITINGDFLDLGAGSFRKGKNHGEDFFIFGLDLLLRLYFNEGKVINVSFMHTVLGAHIHLYN